MRKIISFLGVALLAVNVVWGQEDVLIVKPGGIYTQRADGTDGKNYSWSSVDAKTSPAYRMQKVEGSDDMYKLTFTLDRCFRTSKWETKWGENPPLEGRNDGWMNLYPYRVVFEDQYDEVTTAFRMFEVPADGTEVTFYAKVETNTDGTKKIRAVCDAQEFVITDGAGFGQGNILPAIGKLFTSKSFELDGKESNIQARLGNSNRCDAYVGNTREDFGTGKFNVRDGEPGKKAQGRGIITVHYETVSLSVEKTIDEIQELNVKVADMDLMDVQGSNLGVFGDENWNMPISGTLNTVVTKSGYPLLQSINQENTKVNLCYSVRKEGEETQDVIMKKPFSLTGEPTDMAASWTLDKVNLLEELELENGNYTLSFWFESEYVAEYGRDTIMAGNGSEPFSIVFSVNHNDPTTGFEQPTLQANVFTAGQAIQAIFDGTATVKLYAVSGQLLDEQTVYGSYIKTVQSGLYILQVADKSYRLAVK